MGFYEINFYRKRFKPNERRRGFIFIGRRIRLQEVRKCAKICSFRMRYRNGGHFWDGGWVGSRGRDVDFGYDARGGTVLVCEEVGFLTICFF